MFWRIFDTDRDGMLFFQRVILGVVMFPHGAQKVLGWFGGNGMAGTLGWFGSLGIPLWLGYLAIFGEFVGAILLVLGLLTRVAAFFIAAILATAMLLVHLPVGFFMNWSGQQGGEGYEYHLLGLALALALLVRGGGLWSIDHALVRGKNYPYR